MGRGAGGPLVRLDEVVGRVLPCLGGWGGGSYSISSLLRHSWVTQGSGGVGMQKVPKLEDAFAAAAPDGSTERCCEDRYLISDRIAELCHQGLAGAGQG